MTQTDRKFIAFAFGFTIFVCGLLYVHSYNERAQIRDEIMACIADESNCYTR